MTNVAIPKFWWPLDLTLRASGPSHPKSSVGVKNLPRSVHQVQRYGTFSRQQTDTRKQIASQPCETMIPTKFLPFLLVKDNPLSTIFSSHLKKGIQPEPTVIIE